MEGNMKSDDELGEFLEALDEASIEVNDFESRFIESNMERSSFSNGQRKVILEMIERYGRRIGWT
jgi:hypothetical protein